MKKILIISAIALSVFSLNSCVSEKTDAEILGATTWKLTNLYVNGADFFELADNCDKDDVYYFDEDGSYKHDEGATTCASGDPQIVEQGTWTISSDGASFTVVAGNDSYIYTLEILTETELRVSVYDDFYEAIITAVYKPF